MKIESAVTSEKRLATFKDMAKSHRLVREAERRAMVAKYIKQGDFRSAAEIELGMIQMRSAYNGLCRNVVVPDHLELGQQRIYSAYSQTVPALSVSPVTASAPITRASMTRVVAAPGRITSQFEIPYSDFMLSASDPLEYFEMNAVWNVNMSMDYQLLYALDASCQVASSVAGSDYSTVAVAADSIDPATLNAQIGKMADRRQNPYAILWNPVDYMASVPTWNTMTTSIALKNDLLEQLGQNDWVSEGWMPDYLGIHCFTSFMVPKGMIYLVVQPGSLGWMPIYGDIYMTDNPSKTDQAVMAMTVNAFMGIDIINCLGVTKITLGSSNGTANNMALNSNQSSYVAMQGNSTKKTAAKADKADK